MLGARANNAPERHDPTYFSGRRELGFLDDSTRDSKVEMALEEGFDLLFTEDGQPTGEMLWVDANDIQTRLIGAIEDLLTPSTSANVQEGVKSDQAGWMSGLCGRSRS